MSRPRRLETPTLPAADSDPEWVGRRPDPTVLVVDDQDMVLDLVKAFLQDTDYRVVLAASGPLALDVSRRLRGLVDLLLTDVRMPGMNGPELYGRIVDGCPGARVLYMSGYGTTEATKHGVPADAPLIVKPFGPDELVQRIRSVLGGSNFAAAAS